MGTDWNGLLSIISLVLSGLFGAGGIAALIKSRADAKKGVREDTRAEADAINARTIAIMESQFNYLVTPLTAKVAELEEKVDGLDAEVAIQRKKYWKAINHIRTLYNWMARHLPDDIENTIIPEPPADLVEDI